MQMFSSIRKTEPPPPPPPITSARPAGIPERNSVAPQPGGTLSTGVSIKGSVKFRDQLLIDGEVEGRIDSTGTLTIGKNARVRGEIRSKSITVQGIVEGNIFASERCALQAGCTLKGDIEAPRLVVDENATFLGSAKIATDVRPAKA